MFDTQGEGGKFKNMFETQGEGGKPSPFKNMFETQGEGGKRVISNVSLNQIKHHTVPCKQSS